MPYANVAEAFYARLASALASTTVAGRVFPDLPTQDPKADYAVYRKVAGGGDHTLAGRSRLQRITFRVDVYAITAERAEAILKAMNDETTGLPGYRDPANGVLGILPADDQDTEVYDDNTTRLHGQSFAIWWAG